MDYCDHYCDAAMHQMKYKGKSLRGLLSSKEGKQLLLDTTKRRYRGSYFSVFRHERALLKILRMSPPLHANSYEYRSTLRKVYYCILPMLFQRLRYPPDLSILEDIEHLYFHLLNRANYDRGVFTRANRLFRKDLYINQL